MGWLKEVFSLLELTWTEVLLGLSLFVVTSIGGIVSVSFLLVKLPATYVCDSHPRDFWVDRHPILRWTGLIIKNLLGALIVILGIILSLPGVPGPGILTILMGVLLLDFPGKRRLERWLLSRPRLLDAVNRLRQRYGKPPLILESPEVSSIRPHDRGSK